MPTAKSTKNKNSRRENGAGTIVYNESGTVTIRKAYGKKENGKTNIKKFTGKNKTEAKRKMEEYEKSLAVRGTDKICNDILIDYLMNWYNLYKKNSLKNTTRDTKLYSIQRISKYDIARYEMSQLSVSAFQKTINEMADNGISVSTIRQDVCTLHECLDMAVFQNDISKNFISKVKIPGEEFDGEPDDGIVVFNDEDMDKLFNEAHKTYPNGTPLYRYSWAVILMLYTGIRVGECLGLKIDKISDDLTHIRISSRVAYVNNEQDGKSAKKQRLDIDKPKTKTSIRNIPLASRAKIAITEALKNRNKNSEYLFSSQNGSPTNKNNINRTLRAMMKNADTELKHASSHTLRHTFASMYIRKSLKARNGVDIVALSNILGHSKPSTTLNIYAHLIGGQKEESINILEID